MRSLYLRALTLLLVANGASLLHAQSAEQRHANLMAKEKARLLQNESVQQEIKLTPEQYDRLKRIAAEWEAKHRTDFALARKGDDSIKADQVWHEALLHLYRNLPAVLTPKQFERLNQIHLQVYGPLVFIRPQISQRLGLSDAQIAAIRPITASVLQQNNELGVLPSDPRNPADVRKAERIIQAVNRIHKAGMARIMQVLTPQQQDQWKEMTGEPFELKWGTARKPAARDNP